MAGFGIPNILRTQRSIQTSYEVPHRIHAAKTYPVSSPNGSTIVIYGHETGVRLVWRGGRPFKENVQKKDEKAAVPNGGSNDDVVMILDSDDEDAQNDAQAFEDEPEFEDEEDESTTSYPPVIQYLDLFLGTGAMHIAVPAIPMTTYKSASQLSPQILGQKIVFAVVCGDRSTRLVSLPLTPPSPTSKSRKELSNSTISGKAGDGKWGESIAQLGGHHAIADGVSFTFTPQSVEKPVGAVLDNKGSANSQWNVVLASHSREISGVLLIYSIPILSTTKEDKIRFSIPNQSFDSPMQTQYLSSPAVSVCFKPMPQHPQLLVAHTSGVVRIYDPLPTAGSGALVSNSGLPQGQWLLSLYSGFVSATSDYTDLSAAKYGRKSIIDAKWILSGKAAFVLLTDGEWGIWDIEGVGPRHGSNKHAGVKGGACTPFTISGLLDGATTKSSSARSAALQQNGNGTKFMPMTPGTRRTTEQTLFSSRSSHHGINRGQLVVTRLPSTSAAIQGNECVILWLQESYAVIPNIWSFWDTQARKAEGGASSTLFGTSSSGITRMMKLETVNLKGERCTCIDYFPKDSSALLSKHAVPLDILVTGERRFVIASDTRGDLIHSRPEPEENNQLTIAGGELDVNSIDQALSQMENNGNSNGNGGTRRGVSFLR